MRLFDMFDEVDLDVPFAIMGAKDGRGEEVAA